MVVQIIKEKEREPSFARQLLKGAERTAAYGAEAIPEHIQKEREKKAEEQAFEQETGMSGKNLSPEYRKLILEQKLKNPPQDLARIKEALRKRGVSEEDAELYTNLTEGGKTAFTKDLIEAQKRKARVEEQFPEEEEDLLSPENEEIEQQSMKKEVVKKEPSGLQKIKRDIIEQDEGLTPSERVTRGNKRYDTGLKTYQQAGEKVRSLNKEKHLTDILSNINESGKLPENLGRVNIKANGNLRVPFLASAEAQRYVKTLNEFSAGAKETFGSRVTNFDLQQFMLRYPNLLNSVEGRRQLTKQMKIVNELNSIYYKNLKKVYDMAGGVRNIDSDVAERYAEEMSKDKIEELTNKFNDIGTNFVSRPSAREFKGRTIKNTETGELETSNGEEWLPAKNEENEE